MRHAFILDGREALLWLTRIGDAYQLDLEGQLHTVMLEPDGSLNFDGAAHTIHAAIDGDHVYVHLDGEAHELLYLDPVARHASGHEGAGERTLRAPMPGGVMTISVKPGQIVAAGDTLIVIESMKMETAIRAPRAGLIETIHVTLGDVFERDAPLVTMAED